MLGSKPQPCVPGSFHSLGIWHSLPQDPSHPPTFQLSSQLTGRTSRSLLVDHVQRRCSTTTQTSPCLHQGSNRSALKPQALPSSLQHVHSPAQRRTRQRRLAPPALGAGLQRPPRQGPCAACNVRCYSAGVRDQVHANAWQMHTQAQAQWIVVQSSSSSSSSSSMKRNCANTCAECRPRGSP